MFSLSNKSLNNMANIDSRLIKIAKRAIKISPVDFGIPESGGYRTAEEQHSLFLKGKSTRDGYQKKSYHQTGRAVDFYAYVNGKASWDKEHLAIVACAFYQAAIELDIKIQWGGMWLSFPDFPHIQLMN